MPLTKWTRKVDLRSTIELAGIDADWLPAMLRKMGTAVEPDDYGFAQELRDAAEDILDSDTPVEDANYWLREFYDWADAHGVWID